MSASSPLPLPLFRATTLEIAGTTTVLIGSEASESLLQGDGPATPGAPATGPATPGTAGDAGSQGTAPAPAGNPMQSVMMFALIGAVIWFLIFAPERKARKKREAMLGEIKKGDKVVTTGGLHAEVADVKEHTIVLKAGETRLTFSRASVHEIQQPKSVEKAAE